MATLKLIFLFQTAVLMGHMPFIMRCEPATTFLDYSFPSHKQQRIIAAGFQAKSGADFNNVVGAIDGLVICTRMPNLDESIAMNIGQTNFRCHWKRISMV